MSGERDIFGSQQVAGFYRGTSVTRKRTPPGPYRRPMTRVLGVPREVLMGEVSLHPYCRSRRCVRNICGPNGS